MVRILIDDLKKYARDNHVPIMQDGGIEYIIEYIKNNNIQSILELGTAIGYSAIRFALLNKNIKVTTIERDKNMYDEAVKNVSSLNLNNQIELVYGDALNTDINGKYDLIFIDAAKSQYIKFFEKYKFNLNTNGVIITDNLSFHGMVEKAEIIKNRNTRQLVKKIKKYIEFLKNNNEFYTEFINIGDGISVSKYKKDTCNN